MQKKLKIAQVAPLWYPVPPKGYGGTEYIVSVLTEELVKQGHDVTLFATGSSQTKARLNSFIKNDLRAMKVPWLHDSYNMTNLIRAFKSKEKFDIIHTHIDVHDTVIRALSPNMPSVATLHNPFWPTKKTNKSFNTYQGRVLLYKNFPKLPYISISDAYQRNCPVNLNFVETIHHGVDPDKYRFNPKGGDHFVWMGRVSPNKGLHQVVKMARQLKAKLLIAGVIVSEESKIYYNKNVKPYLNKDIKFIGEIKSGKDKSEFFGTAKAFLNPLQWEEPFGIIMIEAMAAGTPVIAYRRGSVPEIVTSGKTGFVVDDRAEFMRAIKKIGEIDRAACRAEVEKRFTIEIMARKYVDAYHKVIKNWPNYAEK